MQKIIIFFTLFISTAFSFGQEIVPFYNANNGKWGFHTKEFNKIIMEAKYDDATAWYKDYGIVMIDGKYGMVDRKGNKVSPFILDYMGVEECESCLMGQLYGVYFYKRNMQGDRKFYVNENCDCVPQPYWPCPPMVKMDTSATPKNLKILQKAEYLYHQGEIKKSLEMADKAIAADTNEASTYFWRASMTADNYWIIICEDPFVTSNETEWEMEKWSKEYESKLEALEIELNKLKISQDNFEKETKLLKTTDSIKQINFSLTLKKADSLIKYYEKWEDETLDYINAFNDKDFGIKSYYDKALSLEPKDSWPYKAILSGKYDITYLSKPERKAVKKELHNSVERIDRKSETAIMVNPGFSFFPYQNFEISLTFGYADFMFENLFPFVAAVGLGYEKGLDLDIDNYKAILMVQPIGPIHGALNILYSNNPITGTGGIGIRPEFGFNISSFTILYGYNFVNDEKFPGAKGNKVGVRLNLPVWRPNDYTRQWGNNFFRF